MKPAGPQPCTEQSAIDASFKKFVLRSQQLVYIVDVPCSFLTTFTAATTTTTTTTTATTTTKLLLTCCHLLVMTPLSVSRRSYVTRQFMFATTVHFHFVSDFAVMIITADM
jgi:hypothetical protein